MNSLSKAHLKFLSSAFTVQYEGDGFIQAIMLRCDGHSKIFFDDLRSDTN